MFNTNNEDISIVASKTKAYIENFNLINNDIRADVIQDSSIIIEQRIALLNKNGIIGFILVLIILTLFLSSKPCWMGSNCNTNIICRNVYSCFFLWNHIKCNIIIWNDNCNRNISR